MKKRDLKENIPSFLKRYRTNRSNEALEQAAQFKKVKIALLASSTIKAIKEILYVKCYELGILAEIYVGEYNQYSQEILDSNSGLYSFDPDLLFLAIELQPLLGDQHYFHYSALSLEQRKNLLAETSDHLDLLLNTVEGKLSCKTIVHNFVVPSFLPLGIADTKEELGTNEFVCKLNDRLIEKCKQSSALFAFDYAAFSAVQGRSSLIDYKMYYMADIRLRFDATPHLCNAYVSYISAFAGLTRKCLVLDLDNTLWGGIIGEDGMEGIHLGPTAKGRSFYEFQHYILSLYERGVILAINSKNNEKDALEVLENHPHMILKKDHFAAMAINWTDKVTNLQGLAEELNISLDSMVFVDDDPRNREMVREELPQVLVVDLPTDPTLYLQTIGELTCFNSFHISSEDRAKGKMYADQKKRSVLKAHSSNLEKYLEALKIEVTVSVVDLQTVPRVAQLTQKTNQFNLTTQRYQEEQIQQCITDKNKRCFYCSVSDKFGNNGIVGVALVNTSEKEWSIDTFLLSCRVLGREIERSFLYAILQAASEEHIEKVIGIYKPSPKNAQVKEFYLHNSFKAFTIANDTEEERFQFDMNDYATFAESIPSFITTHYFE